MKRISRLLGVLFVALISLGASAPMDTALDPGDPSLTPAERLEALLLRFQKTGQTVLSMEAAFTQHKESTLLLEPIVSTGEFSFVAPDKVRWEYVDPDPISMTIVDGEMVTWYRDLHQAERMVIDDQAERILAYVGAGSSIRELLRYFDVSLRVASDPGAPYELELLPRYPRVAKRLSRLNVWIHSESYLVTRLRYVEPDGDITQYDFAEFELNGEVPDDRFDLAIPSSVDLRVVEFGAEGR